MAVALLALLLSGLTIRVPRVWLPLALFLLLTLVSLLLSGDTRAGLPQVKKLFVYLMLPLLFTVVRNVRQARNLLLVWVAGAGFASLIGIVQFALKWRQARDLDVDFYTYYLNGRITGTMGHWMTFSGEEMLVTVILIAFLLFGSWQGKRALAGLLAAGAGMSAALLLSDTRSVWIATLAAAVFLTFAFRKRLVLVVPVAAMLGFALAPDPVKERVVSIVHPQNGIDSNEFRVIVWRTGWNIIQAHPMLGLGPEMVHKHFNEWLPKDIPLPLPPGYYGHLHSIYVHYAAERGIPAMLMLLTMLGLIMFDAARGLKRLPPGRGDTRFLLMSAMGCVIAILIEGAFELNLGDSEVLTMVLVITACTYVGVGDSRQLQPADGTVPANQSLFPLRTS